jgi:riboflavin kinase/FMN adenylyltransferase
VEVFNGLEQGYTIESPVLTIGTFDGVHVGHQKILNKIKEIAHLENGETVLFTFSPHPRTVLFPEHHNLKLIQTQEEKLAKLKRMGVDNVIVYPFSKEFSRTPATEFVRDYLVNKIQVDTIVIGYDHQFGKNREGSLEHLRELSLVYGFKVIEIPAEEIDDVNVSSTKIRNALEVGDIATANQFLGEPFQLSGKVVQGRGVGRTIGYPTANIELSDPLKIVPANGVYAVRCMIDGELKAGMMNIGVRPTVDDDNCRTIEVFVLDFKNDLYGKNILLEVIQFIRKEIRFDTIEQLTNQLIEDEKLVRHIFAADAMQLYSL